jgi:hypothetical protein
MGADSLTGSNIPLILDSLHPIVDGLMDAKSRGIHSHNWKQGYLGNGYYHGNSEARSWSHDAPYFFPIPQSI